MKKKLIRRAAKASKPADMDEGEGDNSVSLQSGLKSGIPVDTH